MTANEKDLLELLDELGIAYTLYRHEPFFTVAESKEHHKSMPGGHCKCLFLRDRKGSMVLAAVHEDLRVDLKALARDLGLGRFSFGNEERLLRVLAVAPGSVNPFSVMNLGPLEEGETFRVVVDRSLEHFDVIHFHPLHNAATAAITYSGLLKFLRHLGFEPIEHAFG